MAELIGVGSVKNPVVLDPFTTVIEVAWTGEDLMIMEMRHNEARAPEDVPPDLQNGSIYTMPSMRGGIDGVNQSHLIPKRQLRWGPLTGGSHFNNNQFLNIGNRTGPMRLFGHSYLLGDFRQADTRNWACRTDPPDRSLGPLENQCPTTFDFKMPPSTFELNEDGNKVETGQSPDFWQKWYVWYCGATLTGGIEYATYLFNMRLFREDWDKGEGLKLGDATNPVFGFPPVPIPEGGPTNPLQSLRFGITTGHQWGNRFDFTFRTYRGNKGKFVHKGVGEIGYESVLDANGDVKFAVHEVSSGGAAKTIFDTSGGQTGNGIYTVIFPDEEIETAVHSIRQTIHRIGTI